MLIHKERKELRLKIDKYLYKAIIFHYDYFTTIIFYNNLKILFY